MNDLFNYLLQQENAKKVDGEDLELMGKSAASRWADGDFETLTEAVVETVKHAQLSPEQVKRVVEFTNTNAFLTSFRKEGASHHYVHFDGGPANPNEVLADLNDGGGGTVFDTGSADYDGPPTQEKKSSAEVDRLLFGHHKTAAAPVSDPWTEMRQVHARLDGWYKHASSDLDRIQYEFDEYSRRLTEEIKVAALSGYSLGEMAQVFTYVSPEQLFVKTAFDLALPLLVEKAVFHTVPEITESFQKTASQYREVDVTHPLVTNYVGFCESLCKLAEKRQEVEKLSSALLDVTSLLRTEHDPRASHFVLNQIKTAARAQGIIGEKQAGWFNRNTNVAINGAVPTAAATLASPVLTPAATQLAAPAAHSAPKVKDGLLVKAWDRLGGYAGRAGHLVRKGGEKLLGSNSSLARVGGAAAKGAVYAAPFVGGYGLYQETLGKSPEFHKIKNRIKGFIPGTDAWKLRDAQVEQLNQEASGNYYY
jgi:hypothetical protein